MLQRRRRAFGLSVGNLSAFIPTTGLGISGSKIRCVEGRIHVEGNFDDVVAGA